VIRALAGLDDAVSLAIIGEGPLRPRLEALVRELRLCDRVELLGSLDENAVRDVVSRASVFVLASVETEGGDRDGIPVALMEAMALSRPVVSTRVGAIPELVEGAGVLVPEGDPHQLRSALARLLGDAAERARLGESARARIERGWLSEHAAMTVLGKAGGS
jgi:colanic acid/amylovoran biosynthesis glycosyltransferase